MPATKTKQLSPVQQEIHDLLSARPEMSVEEVADLLETSPLSVKQQLGKIKAAGFTLPNGKSRIQRPAEPERKYSLNSRPGGSIEEHLLAELESANQRISTIREQRSTLESEEEQLSKRRDRLAAAHEVLEPPAR